MKIIEKRKDGTTRVITKNEEPSLTDQSFKDEVDVNQIMERFMKTGHLPLRGVNPVYGDLTMTTLDLPTAIRVIRQSEEAFAELPVEVRQKFGYSPEALMLFLNDPANRDEAVKLGLIEIKEPSKDDMVIDQLQKLNQKLEKQTQPTKEK